MSSASEGLDGREASSDEVEDKEVDENSAEPREADENATKEDPAEEKVSSEEPAESADDDGAEPPVDGPIERLLTRSEKTYGLYEYWLIIRDVYLSIDRRTLGFSRILLGFLMITDLFRRTPDWLAMFSDKGVLPNHVQLWRTNGWGLFSIVNAFSSAPDLWALWLVILGTFICVFVGYKTRIAQLMALVFISGMNARILLIENGGYVVYNLLALWTCFLPMGDRFSVDALLASMRRRKEANAEELNDRSGVMEKRLEKPYVSLVAGVIVLQICAIYYFNVIHKTGALWKNGTAVHYVLWVDRMVTPIVADVRGHIPPILIIVATKFVLMAEAGIPIALASPLGRTWARRIVLTLMCMLHIGFGSTFVLGPFAWSMCLFSTLLFTTDDWNIATRTMRRTHRARVVLFDENSPGALWVCRLLKRFDLYELLTFRSEKGLIEGLAVEHPVTAERFFRSRALSEIIAAFPLGPTIAWIYRVPGISHLVDAVWKMLARKDAAKVFGLRLPKGPSEAPTDDIAPIREKGRKLVIVLREMAVMVMLVAAVNQALVELWCTRNLYKWPHPEPIRLIAQKFRFLQGWFMFSPGPVTDDGTILVDAKTIDGRSIDPFTGQPPNWDLGKVQSYAYNQIWSDYFNRMKDAGNANFRDSMKEYLIRLPERTGRPEDTIVSGDVYWIHDMNPPFGKTESYRFDKQKLFSFDNPAARQRMTTTPVPQAPPGG
ncbi:MAG TPA: HTTM domain-containing protein [Polyangium sp.]|nr:HTTM domain-containing protein [Polyangium sp.]